jgi:hypothetical protein
LDCHEFLTRKISVNTQKRKSIAVHVGDELYLGDKLVVVLMVNRTVTPHRVLVGNRKHKSSMYPMVKMVSDCDLTYRPSKLIGRDRELNSLRKLMAANSGNDLIDWEPGAGSKPEDFQATSEIPGTTEKVEILASRVEAGLPLWHPGDATFDDLGKLVESLGGRITDEIRRKIRRIPEYVPKEYRSSKIERSELLRTNLSGTRQVRERDG